MMSIMNKGSVSCDVTGKKLYKLDLDNLVQPVLFRLLSNYLDQGIAIFNFPVGNTGFLDAIRILENNSFTSLFKTAKGQEIAVSRMIFP